MIEVTLLAEQVASTKVLTDAAKQAKASIATAGSTKESSSNSNDDDDEDNHE